MPWRAGGSAGAARWPPAARGCIRRPGSTRPWPLRAATARSVSNSSKRAASSKAIRTRTMQARVGSRASWPRRRGSRAARTPRIGYGACARQRSPMPRGVRSPTPSRPSRASCEEDIRMIAKYRGNRQAISSLVCETEVHRDLYIDQGLFELEMEQVFGNAWVYVGHESQVPKIGDYYATTIGTQRVIMVRSAKDSIKVLHNRCPHKGTRITGETCGNTGRFFRCPYHAWTFRLDGSLAGIPLKSGYDGTGFAEGHAARGMTPVRHVHNYRGFVFGKLNDSGPGFEEFFGEALSSLDNMIDRSPVGKLEVAGGVLRYMHDCNWKMLVENQTDTCHPMIAHQSSAGTAIDAWKSAPAGAQKPIAVEIYAPFLTSYELFHTTGVPV